MSSLTSNTETFHAGLKALKDYLTSLATPSNFKPTHLLSILDSFSQPLHAHLASEPQAFLALSRFVSPEKQFDLVKIEQEEGKKAVSLDFAINVLPIFMNNMETEEFEGGMWKGHPKIPGAVKWILKVLIPMCKFRLFSFCFECEILGPLDINVSGLLGMVVVIFDIRTRLLTLARCIGHWRQWRFLACTSDGRRKQMVA